MGLRISTRGHVRPSVRGFVGRSVPRYFRMLNMAVFECNESSKDIINNDTMSDDEVVASDVFPRYLFSWFFFRSFFQNVSLTAKKNLNFPVCHRLFPLSMWEKLFSLALC